MLFLRALAFFFLVAGFSMVFAARYFVRKYALEQKVVCDFENEMSDDELQQYRVNKAAVNLKMLGMVVALPGLVLVLVLFR